MVLAAFGLSCDRTTAFNEDVSPPDSLAVTAVSLRAVRLEWSLSSDPSVTGYRVERRKDLAGPFTVLAPVVPHAPPGPVRYFDTGVDPDTYYGYRVRTITRLGDLSPATVIRGAKTPPKPGVLVRITSNSPSPDAVDSDGYLIYLRNTLETLMRAVGPTGDVRFPALPVGHYDVELQGVVSYCAVPAGAARSIEVSDEGPNTVDTLAFAVVCRDPNRGRIVAHVVAEGDSLDPDGYRVALSGIADDRQLPDSARVIARSLPIPGTNGGQVVFDNLRPGTYQVALEDLANQCRSGEELIRDVLVSRLSADTITFPVICEVVTPQNTNRPFKLVNDFAPQTAGAGTKVTLQLSLDLRADPAASVSGLQSTLSFDQSVLRFDSAGKEGSFEVTASSQPGRLSWLAFTTETPPPRGLVRVARFMFTAVGPNGTRAFTRHREISIGDGDGNPYADTLVQVIEDTVTVGPGGGGANQPPVVSIAGGAHSGVVGSPITFVANASDPDGTIVSYDWDWGNGITTLASPSTSRIYLSAGTFTARVTVTDNRGGTSSASVQVTVNSGGGSGAGACGGAGLKFCSTWIPQAASTGEKVLLEISADLTVQPSQLIRSAGATTTYDPGLIRLDSVRNPGVLSGQFVVQPSPPPGSVNWLSVHTQSNPPAFGGVVPLARLYFTVTGASGAAATVTQAVTVGNEQDQEFTVTVVEDTLALLGGGPGNQPPIAQANVPSNGTVGSSLSVNATGSADPDGTIVSYSWDWGDGTAATPGAGPSHIYAVPGSYLVTLTVTDNQGAADSDTRSITISPVVTSTPFTWSYDFGAISGDSVPMALKLGLSADVPETPAAEALQSFVLDSLKWDGSVLQYKKTVFTPGNSGVALGAGGWMRIQAGAVSPANATGLLTIATVWLRIVGSSGASTLTQTFLGPLTGTVATGSYNYRPRTVISEITFVR